MRLTNRERIMVKMLHATGQYSTNKLATFLDVQEDTVREVLDTEFAGRRIIPLKHDEYETLIIKKYNRQGTKGDLSFHELLNGMKPHKPKVNNDEIPHKQLRKVQNTKQR